MKFFSGSAHPALAQEIVSGLGCALGRSCLKRFSDGEVSFQIDENIRGTDVFVLQPTSTPVDEHLVELCVMIDAFRRSSAARITAVIPYYGYARQDRKDRPRVPISAKLVANLLGAAGANRVLTMDLHKAQIQGFFDIPVDHLFAAPVFIDYLTNMNHGQEVTIVSPDAGGVERARAYAKRLGADLAIIDKRRSADGHAEVMHVVGEVRGKVCIIQDDIVDTAGTLQQASRALRDNGASRVLACAVHGVLSGPAQERIEDSALEQLIVTIPSRLAPNLPRRAKSKSCRWRRCWEKQSRVFTRRHRSRPCSSDGIGAGRRPRESTVQREKKRRHGSKLSGGGTRRTRKERSKTAPSKWPASGGDLRGESAEGAAVSVDPNALLKIFHSDSGVNTLIALSVDGGTAGQVLVKEFQLDPVSHQLLHVDFFRAAMDKALIVTVPVVLHGEPVGVKQQGGIIDFLHREVQVECLPSEIPEHIDVDVSDLEIGQGVRLREVFDRGHMVYGQRLRHPPCTRDRTEGRGRAGT